MPGRNQLLTAPPYSVEQALKRVGSNLRLARVRRKLTIEDVAEKIGTGKDLPPAIETQAPSNPL